ncbi:SspB family protein [Thalassospira sp.]|uniref:SspB family protein n=1 Tax=Thalassospira sp. TaxID=1912094 RepID=UPI0027341ADE|nr:ClpXP protease specificity-enhancing factor SspB [Thalassospira sp.]MDP2697501.1 ClpXP protease specificity-enhancing factor SspB [Thalassospira sp.]
MHEPEEFRYDLMVDQALRGVVKQILSRVAKEGLFGEHHYYVTFQTNHPGVQLPENQRKAHPDNITVVVQHRFWDLKVGDDFFSVGMSFDGMPTVVVVPFDAMLAFVDPSANFMLTFSVEEEMSDDDFLDDDDTGDDDSGPALVADPKSRPAKKAKDAKAGESGEVIALDAFRKK